MSTIITEFLRPNSASPTIIGKGMYNGKPAYYKMFYNGNEPNKKNSLISGLLYESEVYKFISEQNDDIQKYFIKFLYSSNSTLNDLYRNRIITNLRDSILLERMNALDIEYNSTIHIIVTENSNSITLNEFFNNLTDDSVQHNYNLMAKILTDIFELVFECIYVLNKKLHIQHNDMHFGNILIKHERNTYHPTNENKYFDSYFKISVFDFDRAYHEGKNNMLLDEFCDTGNGCNSLSLKDLFVFIQSLIFLYLTTINKPTHSLLSRYLKELLSSIVPNDQLIILVENMKQIQENKKNTHWSSYCASQINTNDIKLLQYPCNDTSKQDLLMGWLDSMYEKFKNFNSNITKITFTYYYKKYLKYKEKYLKLKNTHN